MRKMLGTFVLAVALLAPPQMVLAAKEVGRSGETIEMNYQVFEKMTSLEMRMAEAMMMLMKNRDKMTKAKMTKIMNMLDSIEREIQKLIDIGDE